MSGARVYTIWVCPECGYYDADPILRRPSDAKPMRCFQCGHAAENALDTDRINTRYQGARRKAARDSAPLMVATQVAELPQGDQKECGFCHGQPVGDAASWLDGKPRPPAPCPRCGKTGAA